MQACWIRSRPSLPVAPTAGQGARMALRSLADGQARHRCRCLRPVLQPVEEDRPLTRPAKATRVFKRVRRVPTAFKQLVGVGRAAQKERLAGSVKTVSLPLAQLIVTNSRASRRFAVPAISHSKPCAPRIFRQMMRLPCQSRTGTSSGWSGRSPRRPSDCPALPRNVSQFSGSELLHLPDILDDRPRLHAVAYKPANLAMLPRQ